MLRLPVLLLAVSYPWLAGTDPRDSLRQRIAPPPGYARESVAAGSFAEWLRGIPLKPGRPPVHLFDGRLKANQTAHVAVVDIDVGRRDLQQCADAIIRLRAEYLFSVNRQSEICFRFTSGEPAPFSRWAQGDRPKVRGNTVAWARTAAADASHASLRAYLDVVFAYAGTRSLVADLRSIDVADLTAGDVFIEGGFPGHAVIVVDAARDPKTGRLMFLLAQSYMPAQDIHILTRPRHDSPWYDLGPKDELITPEWTFRPGALKRFREAPAVQP